MGIAHPTGAHPAPCKVYRNPPATSSQAKSEWPCFSKIEKGGKALKKLSEVAEWQVVTIPNAADYVMLTIQIQGHADELVKRSKAKNISFSP